MANDNPVQLNVIDGRIIAGVSPLVRFTRLEHPNGAYVDVIDLEGTKRVQIFDGEKGDKGDPGDVNMTQLNAVKAIAEAAQDTADNAVSYAEAQTISDERKAIARGNIGAASAGDVETLEDMASLTKAAVFSATANDFPMAFENGTYQNVQVGRQLVKYYSGGYDKTRKVLISTTFDAPCDVSITAKSGYAFTVFTASNGTITSSSGLVTQYRMVTGQQYGMTLRSEDGETDISEVSVDEIIDIEYVDNIDAVNSVVHRAMNLYMLDSGGKVSSNWTLNRYRLPSGTMVSQTGYAASGINTIQKTKAVTMVDSDYEFCIIAYSTSKASTEGWIGCYGWYPAGYIFVLPDTTQSIYAQVRRIDSAEIVDSETTTIVNAFRFLMWTDTSLSIAGKAADARTVGALIAAYPYGVEPFQISLFKQTDNLFSDFCYHITGGYYRSRLDATQNVPRITTTANWQGWLIRVKPGTTYTLGPLDFKLELLDAEFDLDVTVTEVSAEEPNTITSGQKSHWLCLTQRAEKDMSSWMMVEGDTYPETYASGFPQLLDVPKLPDDQLNEITYAYNYQPFVITYSGSTATVFIPGGTRIVTRKGPVQAAIEDTTLSTSNSQFLSYDADTGAWVLGIGTRGHKNYFIGWVNPSAKRCFLLASYNEIGGGDATTKTIAFMGDSITAGVATTKCYHQYINDMYGHTCLNYGYGGSGYYKSYTGTSSGKIGMGVPGMGEATKPENAFTPNNVVARLSELDGSTLDAIVIFAGTNDWGNNVAITDFVSGIEAAFDYCNTNLTGVPVLVITPVHRRYDTVPNSQGKTLREYSDIIIDECRKYGIAYIDTMTTSGLYPDNDANRLRYFASNQDSGLHPSADGHKRIAVAIGEALDALTAYTSLV